MYVFIDDTITLAICDPTWVDWAKHLVLLGINNIFRYLQTLDPLN